MRSASGMVGSCQVFAVLAVVERAARSGRAGDPASERRGSAADSGVTPPSSDNSPAKKPLSQVRCSGVNGALSGMIVGMGGRVRLRSFDGLALAQRLERVDLVAAREGEKAFLGANRGAPDRP